MYFEFVLGEIFDKGAVKWSNKYFYLKMYFTDFFRLTKIRMFEDDIPGFLALEYSSKL